jgi:RsiW-degrading membrane proteinase PrsW (M82 family)
MTEMSFIKRLILSIITIITSLLLACLIYYVSSESACPLAVAIGWFFIGIVYSIIFIMNKL